LSLGGESGLLTVSRASAFVLLLEFASYIYWFYTLVDEEKIPDMKQALVASGLFPASLSNRVAHEHQSLKELRAAAQETRIKNEQKKRYGIYADIPILICSTVSLVFASVYLLEAVHAPSEKLKLSESFVGLVIIPSILATVDHVVAIIRSQEEEIAWVIETAFGSSIRISFFVFPLAIVFGWALGAEVGMILDGFQVVVFGLAIILVNYVIHNEFASW
jgi:calcium/proton exchanger cax